MKLIGSKMGMAQKWKWLKNMNGTKMRMALGMGIAHETKNAK